jgi:2-dehydropantoate 2-reductase
MTSRPAADQPLTFEVDMRVAVIGTGALGCVYAARLSQHVDVCMLGSWAEGVAAVRAAGIHVVEPDGRLWRAQVPTYTDPAEVVNVDVALVLVKSYQTLRAAEWASVSLAANGLAVTLQNGLDNYSTLIEAVGPERAAVGVTDNGATMLAPGEVRHVACNLTHLGVNPANRDRVFALAQALDRAGLETRVEEDIAARLWGKAVANAAINPLTALLRVTNGALLQAADRRRLLVSLAGEAADVARAKDIALPFEDPVGHVESVCRSTAANRSSMLQDVERGRPTEIDSINGIIVAEGKALGVQVGVNEVVWRLVRAL